MTAIGRTNAGKSELLSAIMHQRGYFPSKDVPGHTKIVHRGLWESIQLSDTPGIDANHLETQRALDATKEAELLLYCHCLRNGELSKLDIDFLNRINSSKDTKKEILFIMTYADNVLDSSIAKTAVKIQHQLIDIYEKYPHILLRPALIKKWPNLHFTGAHSFWKGITSADQHLLIEKSGIPDLREFLLKKASDGRKEDHESA